MCGVCHFSFSFSSMVVPGLGALVTAVKTVEAIAILRFVSSTNTLPAAVGMVEGHLCCPTHWSNLCSQAHLVLLCKLLG